MEKTVVAVDKDVIEALLRIARVGERQAVVYSHDNCQMAERAAVLSKDMCTRSIEILLGVLGGHDQAETIAQLTKDLDE